MPVLIYFQLNKWLSFYITDETKENNEIKSFMFSLESLSAILIRLNITVMEQNEQKGI